MTQATDVFISYSREDKDKVTALAEKLRAAGVAVWMDVGGIDAATMWSEEIVNALDSAKVLLLMVTPSAVNSHNVAKEVILTSERKGHILPVHLEPTQIPAGLKYQLAGIQHIEYFQGDPDENVRVIVRSLERIGVNIQQLTDEARPEPEAPQTAAAAPGASDQGIVPGALAVLPFHNISPDEEADYFSDGLTEELIARLSLVSEIDLISRWASMQYKEAKQDIRIIGKELGARYVVGGSVRRFRDSVRITVQLVDAETNRQLWGNTYKGKLDDIFDIQEQVAKQIVEALKLRLSFSEEVSLSKRQTVDANAYDLYLRGQDYLYRLTKRSVEHAIELFEKAIELDPRYAAAYAACSSAYGQMYQYFSREEAYRAKAQELSFKALMYDNNLPEAYTAMGLSYFSWGKFEEAAESGRKAIELNPDDFIAYWTLGRIYFSNSNAPEAAKMFRRVIELKPSFYVAYADLRMSLQTMGETEEAEALSLKLADELLPTYLLQNPDDSRARMFYAITLSEIDRREEAVREGAKALEMSPGDSVMLYNGACLYAQLGESKKAVEALRQAIAGGTDIPGWMKNDPDLDPLRDDPDFIALTSGH
ncbi:MAG: TIR domain-containing protein [Gammaproteobacteria bacterium]